jgi:hypothetical protein
VFPDLLPLASSSFTSVSSYPVDMAANTFRLGPGCRESESDVYYLLLKPFCLQQ